MKRRVRHVNEEIRGSPLWGAGTARGTLDNEPGTEGSRAGGPGSGGAGAQEQRAFAPMRKNPMPFCLPLKSRFRHLKGGHRDAAADGVITARDTWARHHGPCGTRAACWRSI